MSHLCLDQLFCLCCLYLGGKQFTHLSDYMIISPAEADYLTCWSWLSHLLKLVIKFYIRMMTIMILWYHQKIHLIFFFLQGVGKKGKKKKKKEENNVVDEFLDDVSLLENLN